MKHVAIGLCCLAAGFALARLTPVSGGTALPGSAKPDAIKLKPTEVAGAVAPDGFSLEGDWKPAAEAWAERDPAGFYQWLVERGIPPGPEVLNVLFVAWIRQDVDAAFTAVFNLPGDFERMRVLSGMLASTLAAPGGLRAALKWIPLVDGQLSGWTWPSEDWMKSGPPQEIAGVLAGMAQGGGVSGSLMDQFAAYWAKQDMPSAMALGEGAQPGSTGDCLQRSDENLGKVRSQGGVELFGY